MMQNTEMQATFKNNGTVIVKTENPNGKKTKVISFDDFKNSLEDAYNNVEEDSPKKRKEIIYEESGLLPHSNVRTIFTREDINSTRKETILLVDSHIRNIRYFDTIFKNIEIPTTVFKVITVNNKVIGGSVGVIKTPFVTMNTEMYRFPLGNNSLNGGICFGGVNISDYKDDYIDVAKIPSIFMAAPFTDHSYNTANKTNTPQRLLLEQSQGKPFNEDILEPMKTNFKKWVGLKGSN